jgi:hypothetical protein
MPIERLYIDDFSGGEVDSISSLEFEENQFSKLFGVVYDRDKRLRTQWSGIEWLVEL